MLPIADGTAPASDERETTTVVLHADLDGTFTGALMPMTVPLDTSTQWSSLLHGLLGHLTANHPDIDIDGLYAYTWWSDPGQPEHAGILLTRLASGMIDSSALALPAPTGLLGLMIVLTDADTGIRTATLGLRGYVSAEGQSRSDRMFGAVVDAAGTVVPSGLDRPSRTSMRLLARILLHAIDEVSDNAPPRP